MIKSEAEAKANDIVSKSITEKIIEKIMAEKWDGKLPLVVGDGEYILPSELMGK